MSKKISELPAASSVSNVDVFPVVQSGETKKATIDQLATVVLNTSASGDLYGTYPDPSVGYLNGVSVPDSSEALADKQIALVNAMAVSYPAGAATDGTRCFVGNFQQTGFQSYNPSLGKFNFATGKISTPDYTAYTVEAPYEDVGTYKPRIDKDFSSYMCLATVGGTSTMIIDPITSNVVGVADEKCADACFASDDSLWLFSGDGTLYKYNVNDALASFPTHEPSVASVSLSGAIPTGFGNQIIFDGSYVWAIGLTSVISPLELTVFKINPTTNAVVSSYELNFTTATDFRTSIASTSTHVYVLFGDTIHEFTKSAFPAAPSDSIAVTASGNATSPAILSEGSLWLTNENNSIVKVTLGPLNKEILASSALPTTCTEIVGIPDTNRLYFVMSDPSSAFGYVIIAFDTTSYNLLSGESIKNTYRKFEYLTSASTTIGFPVVGAYVGQIVYNKDTKKPLFWDGSTWNLAVEDANDTAKGILRLTGDLRGTADEPFVASVSGDVNGVANIKAYVVESSIDEFDIEKTYRGGVSTSSDPERVALFDVTNFTDRDNGTPASGIFDVVCRVTRNDSGTISRWILSALYQYDGTNLTLITGGTDASPYNAGSIAVTLSVDNVAKTICMQSEGATDLALSISAWVRRQI